MLLAIKEIKKQTIKDLDALDLVTNEIRIHINLEHPHIIRCYSIFDD